LQRGTDSGAVALAIAGLSVGVFVAAMLSIHMFLTAVGTTSWWAVARARFAGSWRSKEAGFALLMIGMIGASLFSQFIGLTFVVGAFYAGILVTKESAGEAMHRAVSGVFDTMTWGFFIPLFFAFAGIEMDLHLIATPWELAVFGILLGAAIVTKVGTGYTVARLFRWPAADSLVIGNLVNSRGAVELAMAVILLQDRIFSSQLFTVVAAIGLLTTVLAPIGATLVWRSEASAQKALEARVSVLRASRSLTPWGGLYPPALSFRILGQGEFEPLGASPLRPNPTGASPAERAEAAEAVPPPLPRPRH
ncbi:MAG: cation:proton antiporter, partial [Thermoplasmata archaeon]